MGYPMTYQRVVNRNGLAVGNYGEPPSDAPFVGWNTEALGHMPLSDLRHEVERCRGLISNICGDLRRLEKDAVDERGICKQVANATGVDAEVVAAVLKEFVAT